MLFPNATIEMFLDQARAKGGSSREVIARWVEMVQPYRSELAAAQESGCQEASRALKRHDWARRVLASRKTACSGLRRAAKVRPHGWNDHAVRATWRNLPLHKRGTPPGTYVPSRLRPPRPQQQALFHFKALRGLSREEALDFFKSLARNYHTNVRSLHRVKACNAIIYGRTGRMEVRTVDQNGNFIKSREVQAGGVWLKSISYAPRLEDRVMTVVFARAGGKRTFEAEVPLMADPENVDLVPKDMPEPYPEPDDAAQNLSRTAGLVGSDEHTLQNKLTSKANGWWFEHFGKSCEWGWRYGRMRAKEWNRTRGGWVYTNGVWIDSIDPGSLMMTVALERTMGRVKRLDVPLAEFLSESMGVKFDSMERDVGHLFYLLDAAGEHCGVAIECDTPFGKRFFGGKTLVEAATKKRRFMKSLDAERAVEAA